jgi:hypothetical protein
MPGALLGLLCAAGAAVLLASRASSTARAAAWSLLASWLLVAAFLVLYPPWFLSVGLVVAAVVVGDLVRRPAPARRLVLVVGVTAAAAAVVLGLWAWESRDALAALAGTTYPGDRRAESGGGSLVLLVTAPLNLLLSAGPVLDAGPGRNPSEVSAPWLVLPAVAAVATLGVVALRRPSAARRRGAAPVMAVSLVGVVLALWTLVPLPGILGRLLLLDRVPGSRTALALGLAGVLVAVLVAGRLPARRSVTVALWSGAVATSLLAGWAATVLLREPVRGAGVVVGLVVGGAVGALWVLVLRRPGDALALVSLAVVVVASYVVVNPLYRGLGPLEDGPVIDAVRAASSDGDRWVVTGGANRWSATVASTGGTMLSGLTYYPDAEVWQRLAPTQRDVWDNFMAYRWSYDPAAAPVRLDRFGLAEARAFVDLCSPDVDFLRIDHVLSAADEVRPPCYDVTARVTTGDDELVVLTRRR